MYRLLLVDDEEEVRKGILNKIDWQACGFEVAGEAENGKEALEAAEKTVPDVVITDIKMPFMDGLTLSRLLLEKIPNIKIIILTGFDEFEYAQKAVKLNLAEYVLKPVTSVELTEILNKVKSQIDAEIAQKRDIQALREHYVKSLPVMREKFLSALVSGKLKKAEIMEKSESFKLDLNGNGFAVSLISIDGCKNYSVNAKDLERELLKLAVLNIAEEAAGKHDAGIVFLHDENIVLLTASEECCGETILKRLMPTLEEMIRSVEKYLKFTITIGVGSFCSDITNISQSYLDAVSALDYRVIIGNNRVICIGDVEPQCSSRVTFDDLKERALVSCIKVGTENEIIETVENLFNEVLDVKASFKDYQIYLLEMMTAILKTAKDLNIDIPDVFGDNRDLFLELRNFTEIQEAKVWMTGICTRIAGYISKDRQNSYKLLARNARDLIRSHFHESDLNIEKVCKYLHISPTYFCTIFKRETKLTFTNYLMQLRMEAAMDILRTTDLRNFEVSDRIGFSEPNYFSYCFKRYFGISPTEYRTGLKHTLKEM